jgi:hypothetical protein
VCSSDLLKEKRNKEEARFGGVLWHFIYEMRKKAEDMEYEYRIKEKYKDDLDTADSLIYMKVNHRQYYRNYKCPHCGEFDTRAVKEDVVLSTINCKKCGKEYGCKENFNNGVYIPTRSLFS